MRLIQILLSIIFLTAVGICFILGFSISTVELEGSILYDTLKSDIEAYGTEHVSAGISTGYNGGALAFGFISGVALTLLTWTEIVKYKTRNL